MRKWIILFALLTSTPAFASDRPADCYGIPWCGCFLRHYFGVANKAFNVASSWAGAGFAASPGTANVAVWRHHAGVVKAYRDGMVLLLSGNDGHAVRERWRSARGVIAWRRV